MVNVENQINLVQNGEGFPSRGITAAILDLKNVILLFFGRDDMGFPWHSLWKLMSSLPEMRRVGLKSWFIRREMQIFILLSICYRYNQLLYSL